MYHFLSSEFCSILFVLIIYINGYFFFSMQLSRAMLDLRTATIVGGMVLTKTPAKAEAVATMTLSKTPHIVFIQPVSTRLKNENYNSKVFFMKVSTANYRSRPLSGIIKTCTVLQDLDRRFAKVALHKAVCLQELKTSFLCYPHFSQKSRSLSQNIILTFDRPKMLRD